MKQVKILIADDEPDLRKYIIHILKQNTQMHLEFTEADNGKSALESITENNFDLIFLDVRMPIMNGLEALSQIHLMENNAFVVMITAQTNVRDAIRAIKEGAYDYLEKPLDKNRVLEIFRKAIQARNLVEQISLSFPILESDVESQLIGHSKPMKKVFDLIKKVSNVDNIILLRGENGTGKDLVARALHFNSNRKSENFIAVNCATIPENLAESELFGHEKGVFTDAFERKIGKFQMANNGTLFLDGISELKTSVQAKLLKVLEDKAFTPLGSNHVQKANARIIAATDQNLEKLVQDRLFREDLYFRLNVIPIFIPPLKERKEDIAHLLDHFINKYSLTPDKPIRFSPEALTQLQAYHWPGNIRELENLVQSSLILASGPIIRVEDLPSQIIYGRKEDPKLDFEKFKLESEKSFIEKALLANDKKINRTVANANIPKNTLLRKIRKFNIDLEKLNK